MSDSASHQTWGEKASIGTVTQKKRPKKVVMGALPRVLVVRPEMGKAMMAPTAKSSSTVPSVSMPISSFRTTAGMRETQFAPRKPLIPKKRETPRRGDGVR